MTNPNSGPDFNDPDFINDFFNSHPDFSKESDRDIEFMAGVEQYVVQLASKEATVFEYLKLWIPNIEELQKLMLSNELETPTMADLIAELAHDKMNVINDENIPEPVRIKILEKFDYMLEMSSVISDIAAKMLSPATEQPISDIKQFIENGEYIDDTEKIVLTNACDVLIKGE